MHPVRRAIRTKTRVDPSSEMPGFESAPPVAAPTPPKPDEKDVATQGEGIIPPALARLHARLSKEVELYKLHVKHYHMTPSQFRKRTTQLALPDSVYEKYDKVCKGCNVCSIPRQAPSRSRVTGIRAANFGDIVFVDHCEVKLDNGIHVVVLLVLDAATHLLWAQAQQTAAEPITQQYLREWMDQNNCVPKTVVGDMAFFTDSFKAFYRTHGINMMPTGPRTPWPNRAETAVRLFKRQFAILKKFIRTQPALEKVSVQQLVKTTVWARNNQLTLSGHTPLELAHGRRPPDLLDYETASPEELTTDPLTTDKIDRVVRRLALQSHIEARRAEDLRLDLARNVRPSDGPFNPGDRVFFFDKDPSKIKDTGRWIRGRVVSQTRSMVTIETHTAVHRVRDQGKIRS